MSIEAMKQALEALEWNTPNTYDDNAKRHDAIAALRQAIEQAEKESTLQEISDIGQWDTSDMAHRSGGLSVEQEKLCKYCGGIGRVVCDGRCIPEQEPVVKHWKDLAEYRLQLLMKMPEQKEWVSLTVQDYHEFLKLSGFDAFKAIEAKLREKNT